MSDCALQAGRQSHVRDIIQEYRGRVRRGGGCTVLLVCNSSSSTTTDRELRASGQVSFLDWPDTTYTRGREARRVFSCFRFASRNLVRDIG